MNKTKPGEMDYVLAWVVFGVCTVVGVFVSAVVAGFAMGLVMGAMGASKEQIKLAVTIMGVSLWLPVSYVVFRLVTKGMLVGKVVGANGVVTAAPSTGAPVGAHASGGAPPPMPAPMSVPLPAPGQVREMRPTLIAAEAILQEWKAKETLVPAEGSGDAREDISRAGGRGESGRDEAG